jgi:predicted DNA-binding WGR domain protein
MSTTSGIPFRQLLHRAVEQGGFADEDLIATVVPLFQQVRDAHAEGRVAPLRGLAALKVHEPGVLVLDEGVYIPPKLKSSLVERVQTPGSGALEIVGQARRTTDVDEGSQQVQLLEVVTPDAEIARPVYVTGYQSWEHAIGHHDPLADIFSLGLLLGSLATGLDFTDREDLEQFAASRDDLFSLNPRLHQVIARTIVEMTTLDRHRRAQDLGEIIRRLENYRDVPTDEGLDFANDRRFAEAGLSGRRRIIQSRLRDRLFEISRRNRLIYFKPTLQTLNLTIGSVPLVLDYRNIRPQQICFWHDEFAAAIISGEAINLGRYLRFEDAPYIPGVLDKIISEARRDRAEYGFAQLRLVLCFLRWHNLKEDKAERIHSPLLLLPVGLTKKKGVRDTYVLEPSGTEAEVNPALRHHLHELYNLQLPETVDLKELSLDQFHEQLAAMIQASEPGVTLKKVDRPRIQLIHERARQRLDQWRRKQRVQPARARKMDYSYDRDDYRPLGLRLFLDKVKPTPSPLRGSTGDAPLPAMPHMVASPAPSPEHLETERQTFALSEGGGTNPYAWEFDLCSLTLGNFNYRKMTLVRDYAGLIEQDLASEAFDAVFSLSPRPQNETPPPLPLAGQYLVIPSDATQVSAIARARAGGSYIIQGPPGTGKSQTITNLIADYVARGKRVLFVCEKRAAIDVVFHRLRQQGLDELCCLIHDSQTDKKAFVMNLKQTYEAWLAMADDDAAEAKRQRTLRSLESDLQALERFSAAMQREPDSAGVAVRTLLHRLVELEGGVALTAAELERLPHYAQWLEHGEIVHRVATALREMGDEPVFAKHPLRLVGRAVVEAERPLELLRRHLDATEDMIEGVESALELSGLPEELWDTFEEIHALLGFSQRVLPLAERDLLGLLDPGTEAAREFAEVSTDLAAKAAALDRARQRTEHWREKLSPTDTETALAQARAFEASLLRFLNPAFYRLRQTIRQRYDFAAHAVAPALTKVLEDLHAEHTAQAAWQEARESARRRFSVEDFDALLCLTQELRSGPERQHPSVAALARRLVGESDGAELVRSLAAIHTSFEKLHESLATLLAGHEQFDFPSLTTALDQLRGAADVLPELLPVLADVAALPDDFARALRELALLPDHFEAASAWRTLTVLYHEDRALAKTDGRALDRRRERIGRAYKELLEHNAATIRASVRRRFLENVKISNTSATQLNAEQKEFKKVYARGRREVEHEFGKTMRYKSIRDLAAGDTGLVVRDLKPIWLMSPLSVSDTLPLEADYFDVVIFDEASQIPVEEAIPAVYRAPQVIVVGDEMQLPPTTFFSTARGEDETVVVEEEGERIEVGLDADSFLTQSARNLPSTLLAWHYRSRYEALISFSNAAFYSGNLFTIPDRQLPTGELPPLHVAAPGDAAKLADDLLARSLSFHFLPYSPYEDRRNAGEAAYIAHVVRELLRRDTKLSIGIVAFSEAQQGEIEDALDRLGGEDAEFAGRLAEEFVREEDDQFCGLFVKNLENVQGDERDIIILSVCYGPDATGKMLMNFGPINQRGGEKRLNVIFSRAKRHMAVVSSIRHTAITNDYNDGAAALKGYLHFAESVSAGDLHTARRVLEGLNPLTREALGSGPEYHAVKEQLARLLTERGHTVDADVGQSRFRCDLAVRSGDGFYALGILLDTPRHYANANLLERYCTRPEVLRAFGWNVAFVLTKDWLENREGVLKRIEKQLRGEVEPLSDEEPEDEPEQPADGEQATPPSPPPVDSVQPEPPPTATEAGGIERHYLEFVGGSSKKFWEITLAANQFTVRFGRLGTSGQTQTKTFADEVKTRLEAERLMREKLKKGYVRKE